MNEPKLHTTAAQIEDYEYFNACTRAEITLGGKTYRPGETIEVRPIPELLLKNGQVCLRRKQ